VHAHARNDDLVQPASVLTYVPLDEGCEAAARDIFWVLTCWDAVVRERAELAEIDYSGMREGHVVQRVARVIAHCLELLATTPPTWGYFDGIDAGPVERDGVYAIGQLCRCHRRAMGMLGLTDPVIRLPGPCPECGDAALQRREEGHWVTCRTCGYRVAYQEYPAMMLKSLAGVDG
jgi:DNA-directed RNA polymerase subunit RPC12/RpoP